MTDWMPDAARLIALNLYPEKFTDEEIEEMIGRFMCHAPEHVVAAARQYHGYPVVDSFGDGAEKQEMADR
jgi:hypothetical protein